ncbi:MAG: shikimate dehydrogenase [Ectothiorhodospiraceae bacterium]|nr:shikimate dehydrogenase [Ectothiorhodospiraceae bacterium]
MTDRYAVMGHPIAHSKSPFIHTRFAEQTGEDLVYEAIDVEPGTFPATVREFGANGGRGFNVTLPFKEEAFALVTERTPRAELAGAVNTVRFEPDGGISGDNTDGSGLVRDLERVLGRGLGGRRALLLGAGGAARGAIAPLLDAGVASLVIANRTEARARNLAAHFARLGAVEAVALDALPARGFDLVVNATSASLRDAVPAVSADILAADACCYDMVYASTPTAFLRWAEAAGARHIADGLGMLVEQAAEAFERWRGVRPDTAPVLAALREGVR